MNTLPVNREAALLAPDTMVELWEIDASCLPGGSIWRFVPTTDGFGEGIIWKGDLYTKFPVAVTGMEMVSTQLPRPKLQFGNVGGFVTNLTLNFFDLAGAKVTRHRTFARYLDGMPDADPNVFFPDDVFYIERKSIENKHIVEFELGSILDVDGLMLPRRQVIADTCSWRYRGSECSFQVERPIADRYDNLFTGNVRNRGQWVAEASYMKGDFVWTYLDSFRRQYYICTADDVTDGPPNDLYWLADQCGKSLNSCHLRFGDGNPIPFGGFPGTSRMPIG